jgi:hypothetical protein
MALGKYYEDIVEARRESGATVVFDYQHPQEGLYQFVQASDNQYPQEIPEYAAFTNPPELTTRDRIALRIFIMKLQSDSNHVARELLSETAYWSLAHFEYLARMSPTASARLALILARGHYDVASEQEPSFRAVTGRRAPVVEIRKRRAGVLYLRHPDFW